MADQDVVMEDRDAKEEDKPEKEVTSFPVEKEVTSPACPAEVQCAPQAEPESPPEGAESSSSSSGSDAPPPADSTAEIVLINPAFENLPATWTSVKGASVCANRNGRFRRTMEDSHVIVERFGGDADSAFFAIYDGHGGRQAVEWVAVHLHENFKAELEKGCDPETAFKKAYQRTDDELGEQEIMYSGTTTATCYIRKENGVRHLYSANAGDARAVLCRHADDGSITPLRLTIDHKANDEKEAERIRAAGGFVVLNRVNGILAVARSLGDRTMKEYVTGEPDTSHVVLKDTDSYLIVACDGIWDILSDEEACNIVYNETDQKKRAEKLTGNALKGGSTDNISVIVVQL